MKHDGVDKIILDACCGGRMMWFDKHHPKALYIDIRKEEPGLIKQRPNFEVQPDIVMDFRHLQFPDRSFKLVVWDPPHGTDFSETSIMAKKFGCLNAQTWQSDLKRGFNEIWRVLEDYGVLVFKWNDMSIPYKKVLECFHKQPLFFNITAGPKTNQTKGTRSYFFCFMKMPEAPE
jgi:hypothetical protein